MEQIKNKNAEEIKLILRIIDKLLSLPLGEQIYGDKVNFLFKQFELISNPLFITTHVENI